MLYWQTGGPMRLLEVSGCVAGAACWAFSILDVAISLLVCDNLRLDKLLNSRGIIVHRTIHLTSLDCLAMQIGKA